LSEISDCSSAFACACSPTASSDVAISQRSSSGLPAGGVAVAVVVASVGSGEAVASAVAVARTSFRYCSMRFQSVLYASIFGCLTVFAFLPSSTSARSA
jgi:hypothetical protein